MSLPQPRPDLSMLSTGPLLDPFGRRHTYLRLSVTDRCNYRCSYCMPEEGLKWMPRADVLSYEEIHRLVRIFVSMGVERVRLTGGEPTLRKDIVALVELLSSIEGLRDLSMTTNAHLLAARAASLAEAGLQRVNISLDSLDPEQFRQLTRGGSLQRVLDGIEAAREAGLTPIKINAVMMEGENEDQLLPMVEYFSAHASTTQLRLIEYMPFGPAERGHWPAQQMREVLKRHYTIVPLSEELGGGPANHCRIAETGLVVGFISPITEHFCHSCNRLRLMANGHLRTCLSRDPTPSLRDLMRAGSSDDELEGAIRWMVWQKVAGHEAHHTEDWRAFDGVMTAIGG